MNQVPKQTPAAKGLSCRDTSGSKNCLKKTFSLIVFVSSIMDNYRANGDFGGQSKVLKGGAIGSPHCIEHKVHSAFLGKNAIRVEWDGIR